MAEDKIINPVSVRQLAISVAAYSSGSILGPLLIFGGFGYFLFRTTGSRPALIISIFVAFVVTNILIIKKVKKIMRQMDEIVEENKKEEKM